MLKKVFKRQNSNGDDIHLHVPTTLLDAPGNVNASRSIVFYSHGLAGTVRSPQSEAVINGLIDAGHYPIAIDGSHSLNDAGFDLEHWSHDSAVCDVESAVEAARDIVSDFPEQYGVAGNSFGGYAALMTAGKDASRISFVTAICPVTSGENSLSARQDFNRTFLDLMERDGKIDVEPDVDDLSSGVLTRAAWENWRDNVDVFPALNALRKNNVPLYTIVGSADDKTTVVHVQQIMEQYHNCCLRVIDGAGHTFDGKHKDLRAAVSGFCPAPYKYK